MHWVHLLLAIGAEVFATSFLKMTREFTRFWPSVAVILGYAFSFYCLALAQRVIPVGIAYAIWSGVGIVFVAVIALFAYGQRLDFPAVVGLGLIMAGVIVINIFSKTVAH